MLLKLLSVVPIRQREARFNKRILEERFQLHVEHFQDHKSLLMDKGKLAVH